MIFCTECDQGVHLACSAPALSHPPRGKWSCASSTGACAASPNWKPSSKLIAALRKANTHDATPLRSRSSAREHLPPPGSPEGPTYVPKRRATATRIVTPIGCANLFPMLSFVHVIS